MQASSGHSFALFSLLILLLLSDIATTSSVPSSLSHLRARGLHMGARQEQNGSVGGPLISASPSSSSESITDTFSESISSSTFGPSSSSITSLSDSSSSLGVSTSTVSVEESITTSETSSSSSIVSSSSTVSSSASSSSIPSSTKKVTTTSSSQSPIATTTSTSTTSLPHILVTSEPTSDDFQIPVTTLVVPSQAETQIIPTTVESSSTNFVSPTSLSVNAAVSPFWSNKSAVAGTFTVVSLVIVGCVAASLWLVIKKRKSSRYGDSMAYERYPEPEPTPGPPSPGPSTSELHQQPMNAYSSSDVMYSNYNSHSHGGMHGPPAASYQYAQDVAHYYPDTGYTDSATGHAADTYATSATRVSPSQPPPSSLLAAAGLPYSRPRPAHAGKGSTAPVTYREPVVSREPVERDSYQPSIDSFYGATH